MAFVKNSPLLLRVNLAALVAGFAIVSAQAQTVETNLPAASFKPHKHHPPKPAPTPLQALGADPDGIWTANASGNWSDPSKWASGTIADGGGKADFTTVNIGQTRTVTIDTASRTVRDIEIGDTNGTDHYVI